MGKKGRGLATTLVLALVIVIVSMALGVTLGRAEFASRLPLIGPFFYEEQAEGTTTGPVVVEGIQKLDRLATVRWTESVPITAKSGGTRFQQLLTGEKVLLVATGDVEAGVDLTKVEETDVRVSGKAVTIDLPQAELFSVDLNEGQTRVYDRDYSILNLRPDDDLVEKARAEAESKVEKAARENGVLDYAQSNAEDSLRAFVLTLGFEKVEFE